MKDPKKILDGLNLPETAEHRSLGVTLAGQLLARSDGLVTLRIVDATLRIPENSILELNLLHENADSFPIFQLVVDPSAEIERVQVVQLATQQACDCDEGELDPFLLALGKERPLTQEISDSLRVAQSRKEWAEARGLGGNELFSTHCSYSTSYSTSTWFGDTSTDSQTDRYRCD